MPRDAVSRTANVRTVGINGLTYIALLAGGSCLFSDSFIYFIGLFKTS